MPSRFRTSLLAAVTVLALCTISPGAVQASTTGADAQPATLAAVTRVVGDETARLRVRVPEGVSFSARGDEHDAVPHLEVVGDGRFVGYALVRADVDGELVADHVAGRLPVPWDAVTEDRLGRSECSGATACPLAAGDYWLYLLADGSPVTVTLHLDGVEGTTTLRPTERVSSQLASQTTASLDHGTNPGPRVRSLGATRALDAPGLVIGYAYGDWRTPFPAGHATGATVVADYGLCTYLREPVEGYLPYCGASGTLNASNTTNRIDNSGGYSQSGFFPRFQGELGFGHYQVAAGQTDAMGLLGLWLEFAPAS